MCRASKADAARSCSGHPCAEDEPTSFATDSRAVEEPRASAFGRRGELRRAVPLVQARARRFCLPPVASKLYLLVYHPPPAPRTLKRPVDLPRYGLTRITNIQDMGQ